MKMKKDELLKRLEEFKKLEDDWDNYGADPINEKVIENTRFLIENLKTLPHFIAPLPWGSIQLEWEKKDIYIEIEVCLPEQKDSETYDYLSTFIMITNKERITQELYKKVPFEYYKLIDNVVDFFLYTAD